MRPPEFWTKGGRRAPMLQALAWPVSRVYEHISAAKVKNAAPARVDKPVICVGNVSLGGVGKTPVARALAAKLRAQGKSVHVLLRGYGGTQRGPLRIDSARHDAREVGDEALLHAADGPTWIAHDRAAGARAAIAAGAELILMDDGFQNMGLAKDLSLLVFDAAAGLGNARVFPSGPLREPVAAALARADGAIVMGDGAAAWLVGFSGPVLRTRLASSAAPAAGKFVAFAGIGRPEKFFDSLKAAGADVAEAVPFSDHHRYTQGDLDFLAKLARERGAQLITTEKDYVRLAPAARAGISTFPVSAVFDDEEALTRLLARVGGAV